MIPMTSDEHTSWTQNLIATWQWARETRLFRFVVWARWLISIGLTVFALLWSAYVLGQDISENLTDDYRIVDTAQKTLSTDAQDFRDRLLNPNATVAMEQELTEMRKKAVYTIAALGGLRAPSNSIEAAKHAYRDALQKLIAVANRIERGETDGMAIPLHNALQGVSNMHGELNKEISYFQGGMWPQLKAAVF